MKRIIRIVALLMAALMAVTSCQAPDSGKQLTGETVDVSFMGPSARTITTDDGLVQTVATSSLWFQYKAEWQGGGDPPNTANTGWTNLPGPGLAGTVKLHRGIWNLSLRAFVNESDVNSDDKCILSGTRERVEIGTNNGNNVVTQTVAINLGYVRQEGNGTLHISATYPVIYREADNPASNPVEAVRKIKVTATVAGTDYTGDITTFNAENVGTLDLTVPAGAAHVTVQYYMDENTLFEGDQTAKDVLIMATMTTNLAVSVDRDITAVTFKAEQPEGTVEDNVLPKVFNSVLDIYPDRINDNEIVIGYAEQTKSLGDQTPITYPYTSNAAASRDEQGRYKASDLGLVPITVTTDVDLRASGATAAWWGKTAVGGDVNMEEANSTLASVRFVDGVTEIKDHAFVGFFALTSVEIPVTVTSIGNYAFAACPGLTSVTIPVNVTSIGDFAFMSCERLANVTIPKGVTTIGNGAFAQCSALTGISIPNSVTSIGGQAFAACPGLTSVTIPVSVTVIGGGAFHGCSLTSLNYSGDLEQWNLVVYVDDVDVICQDGNAVYKTARTRDGESLYVAGLTPYGRNNCTELIIPNCFTLIGGSAFKDCTGLISVTIPDSVTKIVGLAFEGCTNLTSITIPNSVTEIEHHAFYKCSGLTNITIPSSVTKIGDYAFDDCSNLTQINVGDENNSYASVDGVLFSKDMKTLIVCPDRKAGDYSIPSGVTSIGGFAFEDCKALTSVNVPSSVTKIGQYAFAYCDNIVNITLPDVLSTLESRAFYGCDSLVNITIPEGISTVGDSMFAYCQGLNWVSIPSTVTSISKNVFENCTALTNIYVKQAENNTLFANVSVPSGCWIRWNSTGPEATGSV